MAKILDLEATVRNDIGSTSVSRLRKAGRIPAVIYGKKHANKNLAVDARTFNRLLSGSGSGNILVNLKIEGESADSLALVQEVQHDYLKGGILHIDFHAVAADEDIHANVPVVLLGVDLAEKKGGKLEFILHNLEVHCLPKDLPETFQIDVAGLEVGSSIHVRDVALPAGVSTRVDGDVVVAILKEPTVVAETPAPAAAAAPAKAAPAKGAAPAAKAAPAKK